MAEAEKNYLFHIHRKDGSSLFLHPLYPPAKVVETLEKGPLEGRYGREPRVEALTGFRDELYRQVELGVRHWLADLRFIPKFLIASGAFVVAYLFFSIVVRDPLPVIDEVVLGLAAAVASFVLLGRRDLASRRATKKRLDLRLVVDRISLPGKRVRETGGGGPAQRRGRERGRGRAPHRGAAGAGAGSARRRKATRPRPPSSCACWSSASTSGNWSARSRASGAWPRRREAARLLAVRKVDFPLYAVYKSFKRAVSGRR